MSESQLDRAYYECQTCSYGTNSEFKADEHLDDDPKHHILWYRNGILVGGYS